MKAEEEKARNKERKKQLHRAQLQRAYFTGRRDAFDSMVDLIDREIEHLQKKPAQ